MMGTRRMSIVQRDLPTTQEGDKTIKFPFQTSDASIGVVSSGVEGTVRVAGQARFLQTITPLTTLATRSRDAFAFGLGTAGTSLLFSQRIYLKASVLGGMCVEVREYMPVRTVEWLNCDRVASWLPCTVCDIRHPGGRWEEMRRRSLRRRVSPLRSTE
jgi:hypothetical protein